MIKVNVSKESNYPVSSPVIKKKLRVFLAKAGIVSDCIVSVAIVGEKKIVELSKKYLKDPFAGRAGKDIHNVLSFTEDETHATFVFGKAVNFVYPPDGKIYLGEIIVCYPQALKEAKHEGKLIDEKVCELIEHGAMHLLGKHHE